MDKKKYVLHFVNLQFYINHGMVLRKIHRVLSFTQSPWIEPYISFNTEKRKQSTDSFSKDLYKLLSNSVSTFLTLITRLSARITRQLSHSNFLITTSLQCHILTVKFGNFDGYLTDKLLFLRYTGNRSKTSDWDRTLNLRRTRNNPNDSSRNQTSKNSRSSTRIWPSSTCPKLYFSSTKPIFVGAAVLDLSKEHMYSFHYDYILKKYSSDRAQLLFTDTGTHSFILISFVSFDLNSKYHQPRVTQ